MPSPHLIVCPHTHMDTLKTAELLQYYVEGIPENRSSELYSGNMFKMKILEHSLGVMRTLTYMYKEFDKNSMTAKETDSRKLADLKWLKEELMSESLFSSLANLEDSAYFRKGNFILLCEKENLPCFNFTPDFFTLAHSNQRCEHFDMHLGGSMDEATSQGISNGLTLVLMTENKLLSAAFNYSLDHPIPGMSHLMATNGGMKGIRFIANEPGIFLDTPDLFGVDVPAGMSATIGLTAQRIHHLPSPYTNCSHDNPEINLLMQAIHERLGDNTPKRGEGMIKGTYSLSRCR